LVRVISTGGGEGKMGGIFFETGVEYTCESFFGISIGMIGGLFFTGFVVVFLGGVFMVAV
jgi:hypothetical protein